MNLRKLHLPIQQNDILSFLNSIINCSILTLKHENIIVFLSIIYLVLPICLFFYGWINNFYATIFISILVIFVFKFYDTVKIYNNKGQQRELFKKENRLYWIISIISLIIWVYFSGIGGFGYQNVDFQGRNPMFRDLCNYKWPVLYDLSKSSSCVQEITGLETVAYRYYFTWWLPVAAVAKVFSCGEYSRNILLFLWATTGIFMIFYLLNRIIGKCSYYILFLFVFFSGLDIIPAFFLFSELELTDNIEWWAGFFQYSSNTTQLFWVFNQSIPIWLIISLFFLQRNTSSKYTLALCSLSFAYSPWATFGIIPYAIASLFNKMSITKKINFVNIIIPMILLVVYGLFYADNSMSRGYNGLLFMLHKDNLLLFVISYLLFIDFEFLIYFILLGKFRNNYYLYSITLIELLAFPHIIVKDFNFFMRGSIPALFMLMIYSAIYFNNSINKKYSIRKFIFTVFLLIGACTPLFEINRSVFKVINSRLITHEPMKPNEIIYSFGNIKTCDSRLIHLVKDYFFMYNYKNTLFFKYLAKQNTLNVNNPYRCVDSPTYQ